ncbi:OsmC family protein [Microvirga massiliensis]|uniref:OsmC family protein n=1 Tax=Microvirga massiliensis TaxID=1033741 RepID=UPI00062B6F15|nr:OsmC family protein [Microvirga massiliensis]
MSAEALPQLKTVRALGTWKGRFRTDQAVRDFGFTIAEPEKLGGQNEAPTPMEYVVGALNGCLGVVIELVAQEQRLQLDRLEISSAGIVDQRGLFGSANVSPHFQSVEVNVEMATDADEAQLAAFQETVLKRCPVYNLIRDSGAEITVNWKKAG